MTFPVHVVDRFEHLDHVTRQRDVQHFSYHHGYFDGQEREFRGFGMVETWNTEAFEDFSGEGLFSFEQFDTVEEKLHQPGAYEELVSHRGVSPAAHARAGVATTLAFDFKGQPVEEQRQLVAQKAAQADWSILLGEDTIAEMATAAASLLDAETFSASSERDALGRVLTAVSPDGSEVHYHYDEGGALQRVTLHHRGSTTEKTPVGDIEYDAKGRRESVTYGPLASPTSTTKYTYDPLSQRLTRLRTVRASDDEAIQSLHYHYDAVGNITDIRDTAQQTIYFQNSVVEAANTYTYDGLYRLVEATGREHASEGTSQRTHADLTATAQPMTSDPSAMRRYTQQYVYDEVGNILEMRHIPATGTGWTRYYEYDENGNRLLATSAPGDDPEGPYSHEYPHDAHGNMTAMPHLSSMVWNQDDQLVSAVAGTETVYFQYAGGNRVRKYTEKSGSTTEERIYLGNFEIYRKRVSGSIDVERESLHVSDDTGRILLIETKTIDAGSAVTTPEGIWRYQISNHIGSASTELTENGDVISYEEYHPYGTTAYRAVESSIDVSAKRYRYTGMERDEETGLAYHTARYYTSWLGRWTASDPIGLGDGPNRFHYCHAAPIAVNDPSGNGAPGTRDGNKPHARVDGPVEEIYEFEDEYVQGDALERQVQAFESGEPGLLATIADPYADFSELTPAMLENAPLGETRVYDILDGRGIIGVTNTGSAILITRFIDSDWVEPDELRARGISDPYINNAQFIQNEYNEFIRSHIAQGMTAEDASALYRHYGDEYLEAVVAGVGGIAASVGIAVVIRPSFRAPDSGPRKSAPEAADLPVEGADETVRITRAPRKGRGQSELDNGYLPENHPRDAENDGNAYFAGPGDESLAWEYARQGPYEDGIIEVQIPRGDYDAHFRQFERPYQGGPRKEVPIPQEMFEILNTYLRVFRD